MMDNYLCAYEECDGQADSETSTKIILWPQVADHVLDNSPISLALFLVAQIPLTKQRVQRLLYFGFRFGGVSRRFGGFGGLKGLLRARRRPLTVDIFSV